MCGADYQRGQKEQRTYGSPPHVRGGYTGIYRRYNRTRFTPACAGRITASAMRLPCSPVHPRMCGADFDIAHEKLYEVGSPPHVRVGFCTAVSSVIAIRFTPACAGRIYAQEDRTLTLLVHPRMCGADIGI